MSVREIDVKELKGYIGMEGLILQGCGGDLTEWVDGINEELTNNGILLDGTKFSIDDCVSFKNEGVTCMLYQFNEHIKLDMGKLAMWRLKTHGAFSGKWLTDYVNNRLGGFTLTQQKREKPDCPLIGEDGNIFNLIGIARKTLKKNGMIKEAEEMTSRITTEAESYDEALVIIGEYVNITSDEDMSEDEGMHLE